jgi:hypothetical protein
MIIKASSRSGSAQLGRHLLKPENEHVEIYEVRGFIAEDVMGALKEAQAMAMGTRCKKFLFSVSLNPPESESVRPEVFEHTADAIEERLGLQGQPRIILFHEKEGRRHAHVVWSRIDSETMTARRVEFFKTKLNGLAKELFLENGWRMPDGFRNPKLKDPKNFALTEWQQAKRAGLDPRELKATVQDCWSRSDNAASLGFALEERGLYLARGDRRGHVVLTMDGEVFALSRLLTVKAKEVKAKLGAADTLRSVEDTSAMIGTIIAPRLREFIGQAKRIATGAMKPLQDQRRIMTETHQAARQAFDRHLKERWDAEQQARASRTRKGWAGVWDFLTGRTFKTRKQNELEVAFAAERDRTERHAFVTKQLEERRELQAKINAVRTRHAAQVLALYKDAARYRRVWDGQEAARSRGPELER